MCCYIRALTLFLHFFIPRLVINKNFIEEEEMKLILALVLTSFLGSTAKAGCWNECVGLSIGGKCYGGKTKVCNWSGWQSDMKHVQDDVVTFTKDIDREWKSLYRRNLPENVRHVINSTAILFAGAYTLGVIPEAIGGTLLYIVARTKYRADKGKTIHDVENPWIKELEEKGNGLITATESQIALSHQNALDIFKTKIDDARVYEDYLICLVGSSSRSDALRNCYIDLDNKLHKIKNEAVLEVLDSEL